MINNMGIVPINTDKRALRKRLLARRSEIPLATRQSYDEALQHQLWVQIQKHSGKGQVIALYVPIRNEPDLMPLMAKLHQRGFQVALPVVVKVDSPLKFALYTPETHLVSSAMGILEPQLDNAVECLPDMVVLPCVGFDDEGYRLGYGGGFYDRTLAAWQAAGHRPVTVGVAYAFSRCVFERSNFDIPLDAMMTV